MGFTGAHYFIIFCQTRYLSKYTEGQQFERVLLGVFVYSKVNVIYLCKNRPGGWVLMLPFICPKANKKNSRMADENVTLLFHMEHKSLKGTYQNQKLKASKKYLDLKIFS